MEEILLQVVGEQDAFTWDIKALDWALDESKMAQRTLEKVNWDMERRLERMKEFHEMWHKDIATLTHLVRLGKRGRDLSDIKEGE